jgi:hypothetical protein
MSTESWETKRGCPSKKGQREGRQGHASEPLAQPQAHTKRGGDSAESYRIIRRGQRRDRNRQQPCAKVLCGRLGLPSSGSKSVSWAFLEVERSTSPRAVRLSLSACTSAAFGCSDSTRILSSTALGVHVGLACKRNGVRVGRRQEIRRRGAQKLAQVRGAWRVALDDTIRGARVGGAARLAQMTAVCPAHHSLSLSLSLSVSIARVEAERDVSSSLPLARLRSPQPRMKQARSRRVPRRASLPLAVGPLKLLGWQ